MHLIYSFLSSLLAIISLHLFRWDLSSALLWDENTCFRPNETNVEEQEAEAEREASKHELSTGTQDYLRHHGGNLPASNSVELKHPLDDQLFKTRSDSALDSASLCACCRAIDIELLCRTIDHEDTGLPFHQCWQDVKECAKKAGCPLCAFLERPGAISMQDDGILLPISKFIDTDRLSDETKARLKGFVRGRLYVVSEFGGKGLVMMTQEKEGDVRFGYWSLSVGEDCDSCGQYVEKYGLPIRRRLMSTGSESSLNTVRQWMATCDADHDCYPSHFTQSHCPAARLIDVQAFGTSCLDVRLIETEKVNASTGKYIALSYCWGPPSHSKQLITTRATLPSRTSRIPFYILPLTFQHAVRVARFINVRYIWIDALCIVQDDPCDWDHQAAKMCDVYARATLVLASDSAGDPTCGLFNDKSLMFDEEPFGAHVAVKFPVSSSSTGGGSTAAPQVTIYVSTNKSYPAQMDHRTISNVNGDMMLVKRGWTLQEAVLAPRVLHFASSQLVWECKECGYVSEDGFSVYLRDQRPTAVEVKEKLRMNRQELQGAEGEPEMAKENDGGDGGGGDLEEVAGPHRTKITADEVEVLSAWYIDLIVFRYSARNLTYQEDRLPAIAGLADWTAQALQCDYIAGMWRTGFEWALTWRVEKPKKIRRLPGNPLSNMDGNMRSHHAPSFSWISSTGQLSWDHAISTFAPSIRICDLSVQLAGSSPFGRIHAGFGSDTLLRVQGRFARNVVLRRWPDSTRYALPGGVSGELWMDYTYEIEDLDGKGDGEIRVSLLELGIAAGPPERAGGGQYWLDQGLQRIVCVLVLEELTRSREESVFVRRGTAEFYWDLADITKFREGLKWESATIL